MSYPHRASASIAAAEADVLVSVSPVCPPRAPDIADRRSLRAVPLTRRYEAAWLAPSGEIKTSTRLAPATPQFEEAFSALARGSLIQTEDGPVAVEDLLPGMRVLTAEGRTEPIVWIGSMMLYPGQALPDTEAVSLTRITADAFGQGKPMTDLVLGPRARLLLRDTRCKPMTGEDAAYVPARAFEDGCSVIEVTPATPVAVYHLALARQGTLRAMGMEVESYHPGEGIENMMEPRLLSLFVALFPHLDCLADFGPMAHPRMTRFEVELVIG